MGNVNVFISHAGKDTWVAEQIASKIREQGANAFLDKEKIDIGSNIGKTIFDFLNKANELLVLFTPWAVDRPYVWFELGGAWSRPQEIRISPVLHGMTPRDFIARPDIPGFIKSSLFIELNDIDIYFSQLGKRIFRSRNSSKKSSKVPAQNTKNKHKIKYDVFLLSSPQNEKWSTDLVHRLREKKIIAWQNTNSIIPGDELELDAQEVTALKESKYMIIAIDEYTIFKPRTYFELGVAYADNKQIISIINDFKIETSIPDFLLTMPHLKEKSPRKAADRISESIKSTNKRTK